MHSFDVATIFNTIIRYYPLLSVKITHACLPLGGVILHTLGHLDISVIN